MSNHFSAATLRFLGDAARPDSAYLFVFASPQTAGKTVPIFDVNPFITRTDFGSDGVSGINVDTDGHSLADAAFTSLLPESKGRTQTRIAYDTTSARY